MSLYFNFNFQIILYSTLFIIEIIEKTILKQKDKTSRSKHKQAHSNDKATCYTYLQNKLAEERYLARNLWLRDLTRVLGNSKSNEARQ